MVQQSLVAGSPRGDGIGYDDKDFTLFDNAEGAPGIAHDEFPLTRNCCWSVIGRICERFHTRPFATKVIPKNHHRSS
jgi:hypothetical protein